MKKLIVGSVVLAALAGPAWAADMSVKAPAAAYRAPFSWTGCYAGGNFGFFHALDRYDNTPSGAFDPITTAAGQTSYSDRTSSYDAGVQVGCDYQWGYTVWGVVADIDGTGLDESIPATVPANAFLLDRNETVSKRVSWFSTVRGRLGVTPVDGWLFYATGGFAAARLRGAYDSLFSDGTAFNGSASTTRTGYAAGAGVEWNVATNWTVSFEYLYLDFGTWSFISPNTSAAGGPPAPTFSWTTSIHVREQTFRVGVNYHFGGPVIASY
jgi:outer membrane immunogenic protein